MKVNIKKCEKVHVRRKRKPICPTPLILDGKVMNTQDYKYLGCWVNEHGTNA